MLYTLGMRTKDKKIIQKENQLLVKIKLGILTIQEAAKILDVWLKEYAWRNITK